MDSCIAHTSKNMGKKFCSENMKEDTIWETQMKLEIQGCERKLEKPSVPCCQQDAGQTTT